MMLRRAAVLLLMLVLVLPGISLGRDLLGSRRAGRVVMDFPAGPAAFGADSAELDHPFFPLLAGESSAWTGVGWDRGGNLRLATGMAVELVDGVQCLKVTWEIFSSDERQDDDDPETWHKESYYDTWDEWMAVDVAGNLWLLKVAWVDGDDDPWEFLYGAVNPELLFAADLDEDDVWSDNSGGHGEVVSVNAGVHRLRTGAGPFQNCLHTRTSYADGLSIDRYYAPGVGMVEEVSSRNGSEWGYQRVLLGNVEPGFGAVQFASANYSAREENGTFLVSVERAGGSTGVVAVEFDVTDASLTFQADDGGIDYYSDWKVLYLAPGQTHLPFDVGVYDNTMWNNRTTLDIELSNPLWGAELGARTTAQVFVEETESGEDGGTFIGPCFLDTLKLW